MPNRHLHDHASEFLQAVAQRPKSEWVPLAEAMFAAAEFHGPQRRKGGQLYMVHPLEVAGILSKNGADMSTIIAGLLHDVLEDTGIPADEIKHRFGHDVLAMVEATSKNVVPDMNEVYERALIDPRIADIKIADRAANLNDGSALVLQKDRHLHKLQESETLHLNRFATIPGVNQGLVLVLRKALKNSWDDYNQRTD